MVYVVLCCINAEAYSDSCQASKLEVLEIFVKIVNSIKPLTIFPKKVDFRYLTGLEVLLANLNALKNSTVNATLNCKGIFRTQPNIYDRAVTYFRKKCHS